MKRMVVDGEHFDVTERLGEPGVYDASMDLGPQRGLRPRHVELQQ
ncbi:MAG: hypothetical protein WBL35_06395 [Ornithinibacter sp.]